MDGSHNGNLFTFALGAGEELSELDFYGASDAAVQNGNRLIFTEGDYRAKDPVQAFHAAHGASREAVGNAVSIEGGNFLPPAAGTNRLIEFTAAEGTGDMSDNRIDVSGGDFGAQSKFTAVNNTAEAEDVRGDAFALTDNVVSITGGTFRTDADVEVAYSETGTLARNRLMIRGLANGRFNMAYAANTESGNASENAIVIEKASNLYVQVDLFAASAGSAAPSTLADNLLFITDSSIDSSSLGAAMNPSGDVVGNRVDIRNSTLRSSSGGNIFVYGGLHQGYGGLDGKIAGNFIRLEDVTLDLTDRQAAFFIAGQISASEGGVLTNNVVELAGDGAWDERLAQARLVGAGRFGGTGGDDVRENALRLSGWRGVVSSVKGFNTIELSNIPWEAEGAVLRVDREQLVGRCERHDEVAAYHQRFLVGKADDLACQGCRKGSRKAGSSGLGGEHSVCLWQGGQGAVALLSHVYVRGVAARQQFFEVCRGFLVQDSQVVWTELFRLFCQAVHAACAGKAKDAYGRGIGLRYGKGAAPDTSRRTKNDQGATGLFLPPFRRHVGDVAYAWALAARPQVGHGLNLKNGGLAPPAH